VLLHCFKQVELAAWYGTINGIQNASHKTESYKQSTSAELSAQLLQLDRCSCAGALSWQQLGLLVGAFKAASSSSRILVSEAAELMLRAGTMSQDVCLPWQVSSQSAHMLLLHIWLAYSQHCLRDS